MAASLKRDETISRPENGTSLAPVEFFQSLIEFDHFAAGKLSRRLPPHGLSPEVGLLTGRVLISN